MPDATSPCTAVDSTRGVAAILERMSDSPLPIDDFYVVIALWVITMLAFTPRHLINVFSH